MAARGARAAARAVRRIGVLMSTAADDPEGQARIDGVPARACSNWAGPTAATSGSTTAGRRRCRAHAPRRGRTGRAHAGRHPRHPAVPSMAPLLRQPAPCRSCSRRRPIRSAPASSRAWRGRAATSPASPSSNTASAAKWLELLKEIAPRVTRAAVLRDPDAYRPGSGSSPSSRRWRRRSGSS